MTLGSWALLIKIIAAFSSDKYVSQCRLYMVNDNILDAKCTQKYLSWKGEGYKILYKRNDVQRYKSMYICCRPSFFINSSLPSYNFLIAATHIQVILIHNALAVLRKLCFIGTSCPTSYSSRYNKPKQTMKTSVFYLVQRAGTNKMEIGTSGQIS